MTSIDTSILEALFALRDPDLVQLFTGITQFGSTFAVGGIALAIGSCLLVRAQFSYFAGLCVSVMGTVAVVFSLKELVTRARPDMFYRAFAEPGFSFPSGHAALSLALFGFIAYLAWLNLPRRSSLIVIIGSGVLIALVGLSRLYLGLHFFSDVVAGYTVGGFFLWIGTIVIKKFDNA